MTIEAQIKEYTLGIPSDEVAYMLKGIIKIRIEDIKTIEDATKAEAVLELLKDGWTAIPF